MTETTHAYTFGFVLEQTLGHVTHSANLQQNVPGDAAVRALWGLIPWEPEGLGARVPLYRNNWTVRAGLVARRMLHHMQRQAALDALFIHTQVPAILLPDKLAQIPTVVSLDATPLQYDALGGFYAHQRGASWLEAQKHRLHRLCFQRARHLVTWSSWTADSLVEEYGITSDKVTVIPPGVNVNEWQRPGVQSTDNGSVKILFVGGNFERKGGQHLLDAVRALRAELARANNAYAQDAYAQNACAQDACAQDKVQVELHLVTRSDIGEEPGVFVYRDMQPNSAALKALFHASDIFCLPTLGDCLPMVLSEAGAANLPLVATDVGAVREIVRDGQTGMLTEPGNVKELVTALRTLIQRPELRMQMGMNAQNLVRRHYDATRNTYRLLELMKQTVHAQRTTPSTSSPVADIQTGQ